MEMETVEKGESTLVKVNKSILKAIYSIFFYFSSFTVSEMFQKLKILRKRTTEASLSPHKDHYDKENFVDEYAWIIFIFEKKKQ